MKKIILIATLVITVLLILTAVVPSTICQKDDKKISNANSKGTALFGYIYMELDLHSMQAEEILDNYYNGTFPGMLTGIDIVAFDPNQGLDRDLIIAPFFRTLIGDWIGIGPYFEPIFPDATTTLHIKLFWGDIHTVPHDEAPYLLIVDGIAPLLSWEY